jgi:hypothetical protein
MGNCIHVFGKDEELIGEAEYSMFCAVYVDEIAKKYNPNYDRYSFNQDINEELKPVYENGTLEDQLIILVFMNEESNFEESDLVHFEKAISFLNEEDRVHRLIKAHLVAYIEFLKEHKFMKIKHVGVSMSMMVSSGN